jgi:cellulose biosynthesis protein BcsQ
MSVRFSQTLQRTYDALRSQPWHAQLQAVTIVRDVKGQVHLFLEGHPPNADEQAQLSQVLSSEQWLGPYWTGDIWLAEGNRKQPAFAMSEIIRDQRSGAPWETGAPPPVWYVLERHVAKQSWTERPSRPQPPWQLSDVIEGRAPAVIACFSFKGGVGRTTVAGAAGLVLARHGHRVALADLDLEAPGLGSMFLVPEDDQTGVIDFLIERPVQRKNWRLRESLYSVTDPLLLGDAGATLRLLPVGCLDDHYLQKLSRVDVQNLAEGHLSQALRELLLELHAEVPGGLDFILLDARAGFHELGALALCELAHAAVVFGIHSTQSWARLELVVERLARPEQEQGIPIILVHALAPLVEQPGGEVERTQFVERAYDLFSKLYYRTGEVPDLNDPDQPHMPLVIPWQPELRGDLSLSVESQGVEKVKALVHRLTGGPYLELAERLCSLFGRAVKRERGE